MSRGKALPIMASRGYFTPIRGFFMSWGENNLFNDRPGGSLPFNYVQGLSFPRGYIAIKHKTYILYSPLCLLGTALGLVLSV